MKTPVTTKSQMYSLMAAGAFGNVSPAWTDYNEWARGPRFGLWGLRHRTTPGFRGTRLNVPTEEVRNHLETAFGMRGYNISPMTPGRVLWEGDVTEFYACGNLSPVSGTWRTHMKKPVQWRNTQARCYFRAYMTPDSYDDLQILLESYPDHVVELSILDSCYGTVPGRNAVVWEVRKY